MNKNAKKINKNEKIKRIKMHNVQLKTFSSLAFFMLFLLIF